MSNPIPPSTPGGQRATVPLTPGPSRAEVMSWPDASPTRERIARNLPLFQAYDREAGIEETLRVLRDQIREAPNQESKEYLLTATLALLHRESIMAHINPNVLQNPEDVALRVDMADANVDADFRTGPDGLDVLGASQRLRPGGFGANETNDDDELDSIREVDVGQPKRWTQILIDRADHGYVVGGDGSSAAQARVVGTWGREDDEIEDIQMGLSADLDREALSKARATFIERANRYAFRGMYNGRTGVWMRAHPWVVNAIAHHFFVDFMGPNAIKRIRAVVAGGVKGTKGDKTVTRAHAMHAEKIVKDEAATNPVIITRVFMELSKAIHNEAPKDAYFHFMKMANEVDLMLDYSELVTLCRNDENGPEAQEVKRYAGNLARGVDWGSLCKRYLSLRLGMSKEAVRDLVFRATAYRPLVDMWGSAILILLDNDAVGRWSKYGVQALPRFIMYFRRVVPAFDQYMVELRDRVAVRLLQGNGDELKYLADQKISGAIGSDKSQAVDMITRVREAWTVAPSVEARVEAVDADMTDA